jgi:peptide/nickel transport system permease protein
MGAIALDVFRRNRPFAVSFIALAVIILASIAAPLITIHDPIAQDLTQVLATPSWNHWLGTDDLGRDNFSRLVYGGRASLYAAAVAVVIAFVAGLPIGILAGTFGGVVDKVLMRVTDALLSFPAIVLALAIAGVLGGGLTNAMIAIGISFAPRVARLSRAQILGVREMLFVEAAVVSGSTRSEVLRRNILPNSAQPLLVEVCILIGLGLLAEAGLSYLGLGIQAPDPSWGNMIARSYVFVYQAGWQMIIPGAAVTVTVLAANFVGDGVREILDPRRRTRR